MTCRARLLLCPADRRRVKQDQARGARLRFTARCRSATSSYCFTSSLTSFMKRGWIANPFDLLDTVRISERQRIAAATCPVTIAVDWREGRGGVPRWARVMVR